MARQKVHTYKHDKRLDAAFVELEQRDLIAKQKFSCCQRCAGFEITEIAVKLKASGKTVNGCVYYHAQDNDDRKHRGVFYVAYGNMQDDSGETIGLPDEEVGKIVCEVLSKHGIKHEWDGNPKTRIKVFHPNYISV